jgi:hypothetical protein
MWIGFTSSGNGGFECPPLTQPLAPGAEHWRISAHFCR